MASAADPPFTLPKLPYAYDALEPYIDVQTMQIHHDKHHQAYVDNLNKAVASDAALSKLSVDELLERPNTRSGIQTRSVRMIRRLQGIRRYREASRVRSCKQHSRGHET